MLLISQCMGEKRERDRTYDGAINAIYCHLCLLKNGCSLKEKQWPGGWPLALWSSELPFISCDPADLKIAHNYLCRRLLSSRPISCKGRWFLENYLDCRHFYLKQLDIWNTVVSMKMPGLISKNFSRFGSDYDRSKGPAEWNGTSCSNLQDTVRYDYVSACVSFTSLWLSRGSVHPQQGNTNSDSF